MVHRLHTKCRLTSRTEEECHPTVRGVRAGESVLGAEKTVALGTGLARERRLLITGEPPKQAEDRKKPNPSACTGLAEHLLPRRHGLIQSFPSIAISWIMHLRSASALANCHLVMLCHGEEYVSPIVEQPSFSHHVVCRRIHIVVAFSASVRRAPAPEEKDSEQTGRRKPSRRYRPLR